MFMFTFLDNNMIENKAEFNYPEISVIFGDNNLHNIPHIWNCIGVSTDTRSIQSGNLFVALKGETFDGNTKALEALTKESAAVLIDINFYKQNTELFAGLPVITFNNTLTALGKLATFHRHRFDLPIVAVGGSNGKTTTKDMIASILMQNHRILKTESNYNNQVGVPLTLLSLDKSYEFAVIEIGTNEPGEIAILSNILQPTHGLITNIGREHLEQLIDLDGVEMEESYLFGYLKKHAGKAFINYDDERLKKYASLMDKSVTYGTSNDSDVLASIEFDHELYPKVNIKKNEKDFSYTLGTVGYASALNSIAACAITLELGVSVSDIVSTLQNFKQSYDKGYARMALQTIGFFKVLNDCYNANPDSMRVALKTLDMIQTEAEKYAVLGDMLELGDSSEEEHLSLLTEAVRQFNYVLVYGPEMTKAADKLQKPGLISFPDKLDIAMRLKQENIDEGLVLIKGSRGMKMEEIINYLAG